MSKRKLDVTLVLSSVSNIIELIDLQDILTLTGLFLPISKYEESLETIGLLEVDSSTRLLDAKYMDEAIYVDRLKFYIDGRKHSPSFAGCLLSDIGYLGGIVEDVVNHMFLCGCDVLCIICNELNTSHIAEFCDCISETISGMKQDYSRVYISCGCIDHFNLLLGYLQSEDDLTVHTLQYGEEVEDVFTV